MSPAQMFAMQRTRSCTSTASAATTLRAVALASYHHAQQNPRAVMYGRPLTAEAYDASRWIVGAVPPLRLLPGERRRRGAWSWSPPSAPRDFATRPVYVLGAAQGAAIAPARSLHNDPDYAAPSFSTVAPRL